MLKKPIVLIDDDQDDLDLLQEVFETLDTGHNIITFTNAHDFLIYIKDPKNLAFIVVSDINMSGTNGIELRDILTEDEAIRLRCIPFIFMSTTAATHSVLTAFNNNVQGYFKKPNDIATLKTIAKTMIEYWTMSETPSKKASVLG